MSWFGEGLSNLKGQISSFTKEVLAEASAEEPDRDIDQELETAQKKIQELELLCSTKDNEVSRLQQRANELEARLKLPQPTLVAPSVNHSQTLAAAHSPASTTAVEEEQDGWSQFSEEDFPCLEQGDFSSCTAAATSSNDKRGPRQENDEEKATLRKKLQDSEARVSELESQRWRKDAAAESEGTGPQRESLRACQHLVNRIIQMDEKGSESWSEEKKQALESLMAQLRGELRDKEDGAPGREEAALEAERNTLRANLAHSEQEAEDLRAQVVSLRDENASLTRSLEELDEQNQLPLQHLLGLKETLQQEKDSLTEQLKASEAQLQSALAELEEDVCSALRQSLPESVAQEVASMESAVVLGRAVARQCADLVWKKEASERKLAEVMREARELRQELGTARSEVAKLREHSERLMAQLSVAGPSSSGALEPIPEGREEEGDVAVEEAPEPEPASQVNIEALQREVEALREARVNLEAEVTNLRSENQGLASRVRSQDAELRNQENLQREATAMQERTVVLKQQVEDASSHRETLEQELSTLRSQVQELREKVNNVGPLQNEVEKLKNLAAQAMSEKESLVEKLKNLAAQAMSEKESLVETSNQEISRLTQLLEEELLLKKNTQQELDDLKNQIHDLQEGTEDNLKLQKELESCKNQFKQSLTEKEDAEKTCKNLKQQVQSSSEEIQSLNIKFNETVSEKEKLQNQLEQEIKKHESESSSTQTIDIYAQQVSQITTERNNLQLECKMLQESLQKNEEQIRRDKKEFEKDLENKLRLAADCERLQLEVENALGEKLKTEQELTQHKIEMEELLIKLETNTKNYEQVIETEKQLRQELEDKLNTMEKSYRDVVSVAENLESETIKWKTQAELVMNKPDEDEMLVTKLEAEINEWRNKAVNIEESYQMTSQGYQEIVRAMEAKEKEANTFEMEAENLRIELDDVNEALNSKTSDCISLEETIMQLQEQHKKMAVIQANLTKELEEKCKNLEQKINELENNKTELKNIADNLKKQLGTEQKKFELEVEKSKSVSEELRKLEVLKLEIENGKQKLEEELCVTSQKLEVVEAEKSMLQQQMSKTEITDSNEFQTQLNNLVKEKATLETECSALKQQISATENLKQQFVSLQAERVSILGVLDEKTRENVSLRSENHHLMALVANEKATSQKLLQEKTELLSRKEFQSSEASEMARESVASLAKIIRDKDQELESLKSKNQSLLTLMQDSNPGLAIHQLFANHPDLESMKSEVNTLQQEKNQLVHSLQQKHHESLQYHAEIQRLSAVLSQSGHPSVNVEPSAAHGSDLEQLMQSLSQEQQRNKFLQNEVQELSEKEGALQGELGRLRQHLVAVEEQYTEEALRGEQLAQELRAQLAIAEERARNTVTSLSSASARAGQQVELLQEQARVAIVQRDDALRRLSAAEEEVRHHSAGLRNLQTVLEQFQQDKERDIELASERLRQQLRNAEQRSEQMMADMKALQAQLQEAKEGLSAAARLSVQMDKKADQITNLKDEVSRLGEQLQQAQGQINSASQSMEGKVDKYLVKNLIVGYFMAAHNNRLEALRIVATVLDFSREERARVGLEAGTPGKGAAVKGGPQTQSLAEAFIRFLENESRPVPQVRMLEDAVGRQRKSSPAPGRSPLLMSEMVLPSFAPVPTLPSTNSPSSSSSTLKDVLRES